MAQLADFLRFGVIKSWRKLVAAVASPVIAAVSRSTPEQPGVFRSRYGVQMTGNWGDRTFRYCIFGTYGEDLADVLRSRGRPFQFVDIGANQGLYSLIAGQNPQCELIVAFEPVPATFDLLSRNIALNGLEGRAQLHRLAIAAEAGQAQISLAAGHSGTASLSGRSAAGVATTISIDTVDAPALDRILANPLPAIVKIDVEGLEEVVIAELLKTAFAASIEGLFYEVDERWSDPGKMAALLQQAGFTQLTKIGRGHHYDVFAERG